MLFPSGFLLSVFFSLPLFFLPFHPVPFFLPWLPSFYNELIQWDFSLLPLRLHQLFLVCCGHPFKIIHPPIGCPNHCHCSVHVCCTATHFMTKFSFVCSCCIPLPHYLALWHALDDLNRLLLFLGKIPSQQDIFPKRSHGRKPNIDPLFPLPSNHALWIPLTVGPPPLYWLGTSWWCSDSFVFAPLSSVFVSHAVSTIADLFCSATWLYLFLHTFPTVFVISFNLAFIFFTRFLLLTLLTVPCFFSPCFFISVFTPIFFIQKNLGLCGPNNVDWIKRVLGLIYLYLPKPFCQRTVFCSKFVFYGRFVFCCKFAGQIMLTGSKGSWAQFIFICRSHSARELYSTVKLYSAIDLYSAADLCFAVDYFYLHFFLWKFLALWSSWWVFGPCFSLGFLRHEPLGTNLQNGH